MKCSFCSETETLAVKMVFFLSHIFNSIHVAISPIHPEILFGGPSVAPDVTHDHPYNPSIYPLHPTLCFFEYLCFYRTLMAVFKTQCDV